MHWSSVASEAPGSRHMFIGVISRERDLLEAIVHVLPQLLGHPPN